MLMVKERRAADAAGVAISVLLDAGAIRECEVHGWMNSYGGVVPHPFFAVSKADGSFEIRGLPEGTFTVEVWHEQLGTQTQKVTVDGTSGATVDFAFATKA